MTAFYEHLTSKIPLMLSFLITLTIKIEFLYVKINQAFNHFFSCNN